MCTVHLCSNFNIASRAAQSNSVYVLPPPQRPLLFFVRAGKWGEVKSKRAEPGKKGNESARGTLRYSRPHSPFRFS